MERFWNPSFRRLSSLARQCQVHASHAAGLGPRSRPHSRTRPGIQHLRCVSSLQRLTGVSSALEEVLEVSEEVADALATNKPVVALESTIYTHGALGPDLELESIVRRHGGIPAVVGVVDGVPKVGVTPAEVERMINEGAQKVSRRDLGYLVGMVSV